MLKAAFTLAFAAFLRAGEFTSPRHNFSPSLHPTLKDAVIAGNGTLHFHIKQSKTDQIRKGHSISLPPTNSSICSVRRMKSYRRICTAHDSSPLFHFRSGSPSRREPCAISYESYSTGLATKPETSIHTAFALALPPPQPNGA